MNDLQITVKQLRYILFDIDDQTMTIKELRQRLFGLDDQDAELNAETVREINNAN